MMRLQGRVALISGAASGIGYAIARRFADEGANVSIADLNGEGAERAAARINAETSGRAVAICMDVSDEASVEAGVRESVERFGDPDILCSNAGIQHIGAVHELGFADWKRVTGVHLDGAFLLTRACLRRIYGSGEGGSILYIGSVHSKVGSVLKAPYVAAKHGLVGLCRVVAKEGAPFRVRANVICPGFVRTPLVERQIPEQAKVLGIAEEDVIAKVMLKDTIDGEFTTTEEIADTAVFLAEQTTLALSGQTILVSHGWGME